jgi:hypothetical protein
LLNDFSWIKKSFDADIKSAELSEKFDLKHSVHSYSYAGDSAKIVYITTKEKIWAEKAICCFKKFLDYYRFEETSQEIKETIEITEKAVCYLKNKLMNNKKRKSIRNK